MRTRVPAGFLPRPGVSSVLTLLAAALLCLSTAMVAQATARTMTIDCFGAEAAVTPGSPAGAQRADETATATKLFNLNGIEMEDDEEFYCVFIVPTDHDDSGDDPKLLFFGWIPDADICGGTCFLTANLGFDVNWREYVDGDAASASWSFGGATGDRTMATHTCGLNKCCTPDILSDFESQAADADDWDIGDIVFLRVTEDSDFIGKYYAVGQARLEYTVP